MRYKILESFIDEKTCAELISDAKKYSQNDNLKVLNNRLILPSSSIGFLLKKKLVTKKFLSSIFNSFCKIFRKDCEFRYSCNLFQTSDFSNRFKKPILLDGKINLLFKTFKLSF